MYYAVSKLDADKFANLDFVMNFGITGEYKVLFSNFIANGGTYSQAKENIFQPTPTLMLLKLHNYFNWADKKLHTAFFIDNKDQINEDLLADFKEGQSLEVNPGLAQKKPKVIEKKKPAGFTQREQNFFKNADVLRTGISEPQTVDMNSQMDFPTLGSEPAQSSKPLA